MPKASLSVEGREGLDVWFLVEFPSGEAYENQCFCCFVRYVSAIDICMQKRGGLGLIPVVLVLLLGVWEEPL